MTRIKRARIRTLRMTITIVAVFLLCWTPYVTMMLWLVLSTKIRPQDKIKNLAFKNSNIIIEKLLSCPRSNCRFFHTN